MYRKHLANKELRLKYPEYKFFKNVQKRLKNREGQISPIQIYKDIEIYMGEMRRPPFLMEPVGILAFSNKAIYENLEKTNEVLEIAQKKNFKHTREEFIEKIRKAHRNIGCTKTAQKYEKQYPTMSVDELEVEYLHIITFIDTLNKSVYIDFPMPPASLSLIDDRDLKL